jgi:hypothetical protein
MPQLSAPQNVTRAAPFTSFESINARSGANGNATIAIVVVALCVPYTVAIYLGDLKLTAIKILIISLVVPAISKLILGANRKTRRLFATDLFALGVFTMMVAAPLAISGSRDFVSAFSQAIEFYGMYLIGRAFVFEASSLETFIGTLQIVLVVVVGLAALDIVFQRYVALELSFAGSTATRDLSSSDPSLHRFVLGVSSLRATSTFDHPILFGTFCATIIPLHLYPPMSTVRRIVLVAISMAGSLMALSSAPLLAASIAFGLYFYDLLMNKYAWRWTFLLLLVGLYIGAFCLLSNNPLSWVFRNLTLDPQTAYFRLLIWDAGLDVIYDNPWLGIGFNPSGNRILDTSTDSLWLAKTLIYGIPMTTLLYLAPIAAMLPARRETAVRRHHPLLDAYCTGFSILLVVTIFISITVTFWNAVWLFFAMCIGIRTSLKERCAMLA